ncbi:MAG TPA: DUF4058 family protein [Chloroflexota bacterium]|nr:DUF4058 family protein [Chloroflexota bacterium]
MPSPFPGMDPYLEERSRWPGVHQRLITYMAEILQPHIRPKYIASIGERIQLADVQHTYIPDVFLARRLREPAPTLAIAGMVEADEPQTIIAFDEERHVPYLEIIYRETGEVVTVIEVLSPANKVGDGRTQYLQKQAELLHTQANLVEIDLLGYGEPTVLARNAIITEPADWRYLINISRAGRRNELEFYAVPLRDRLPRCRIPLRPPDPDAVLDLTAVFTRCYDAGGYDLLIDYSQPPSIPLRETETTWLTTLLQSNQ